MPIIPRRAAFAFALAASAAAAPLAAVAQDASVQPGLDVQATHGAWNIVCTQSGACAMEQKGQNPQGGDVLLARITKITPRETPQGTLDTLFSALAPLGVALRAGLAVQIDGGQVQRMPFEVCDRNGCVVQTLVPAAFIDAMKKGVAASFTMTGPDNQQVATEVSLSGFTKAYNSLQPTQ